jgi:hypothetical protein
LVFVLCFGVLGKVQQANLLSWLLGMCQDTRALPILMNEVKIIMDVDHGPYEGEASYTYSLRMKDLTPTYRSSCNIPPLF